jgi:hypothetical protein
LRNAELTVEGRERRKVNVGSIVILETYEPGVFDAVPLRESHWENNPFGYALFG